MRQKKVVISTVMLLVLTTGCVKPTNEPNQSNQPNRTEATVYNEQPVTEVVYADNTTPVYTEQASNTNTNDNVYVEDATVISTNAYEQPTTTTTAPVATTPVATGPYDDPYASGTSTSNSSGGYVDPYATSGGGSTPNYGSSNTNTYSNNSTYTENTSYNNNNTSSSYNSGSSIHLQVAALRDYYAAEEFKNTLSLPPKYSAYIKRGAMNKVIIKGFSSREEAKALAARQFPGAFIVAGSSSSGGGSSYSGGSSYTPPPASYTPPHSSYTPPAVGGNSNSGIGVQIGAFSSQSKAREAAQNAAAGRYTAVVKTVTVRGRTLYKAILLGFNSRQEAKSAIASGQFGGGFVVTNIYP